MERSRRDVLGLAGVSAAALSGGCLSAPWAGNPTEPAPETPTDAATETPTDPSADEQLPADLGRVDEPPYDISVPECGDDQERDPLYLCANMASEPSLSFEQANTRGSVLGGEDAFRETDHEQDAMYVTLLTTEADRDRVSDDESNDAADLIRETDFDSHAVLVVETGRGSGSVYPHIKRVETTDTGVHAFGCHTDPCVQTDDLTSRTTAVRFERSDTVDTAVVSLTVAPDERWNVAAGEGVVTIPDAE